MNGQMRKTMNEYTRSGICVSMLLTMMSLAWGQETQTTQTDWCAITTPTRASTNSAVSVRIDYRNLPDGQKLFCDLHWNKANGAFGGFNVSCGAGEPVSGTGAHTFTLRPRTKVGLGSLRAVVFVSPKGWGEATQKAQSDLIPTTMASAPPKPKPAPRKVYPPGKPGPPIISADRLAAPKPPILDRMGLKTTLIDFIDCTDDADPHEMKDLGTSKVVKAKAGTYRVTAPHNHAYFAYRYHTAGKDQPVLLVVEYPDDADRIMNFITHDSSRPYREHLSFSTEGGVYTGGAYPTRGKMQYFTQFVWPQDHVSPLIVGNNNRVGAAAAASRIWVYRVDEMPPVTVPAPDAASRRELDIFFPLLFLAQRDKFGWKSPRSIEHLADYCRYLGIRRVTAMVYANQSWGAMCKVKAWEAEDDGNLEKVLDVLDRKGVGFVAGIVADGMYGQTRSNHQKIADMDPAQAEKVLKAGFRELVERYGKYKSFQGIALCSMEAFGFTQMLMDKKLLGTMVEYIHSLRDDLDVIAYAGNAYLQSPHMHKKNKQFVPVRDVWQVITDWESAGGNWTEAMGEVVTQNWTAWKKHPTHLRRLAPRLHVYEQRQPDDFTLSDAYLHLARTGAYFDLARAANVSDAAETPYASIFGTFMEAWYGLKRGRDFWDNKAWLAPEYNPAGPNCRAAWANALANRDRLVISAGSWCVKYFGTEPWMRDFARQFGSLPPVEMRTVPSTRRARVVVRWAEHRGLRHVHAVSRIPFSQMLSVDGKAITVEPFGLLAWRDAGKGSPKVTFADNAQYTAWLRSRFDAFDELCAAVKKLDPTAAPPAYANALDRARALLNKGQAHEAERTCTFGMAQEMKLRKRILSPTRLEAPRGAVGKTYRFGAKSLQAHVYFPTSWKGEADLSATVTFRNDGKNLYILPTIRDSIAHKKDAAQLYLSPANWRKWRGMRQEFDCRPITVTSGREISVPIKDLGVVPGGSVGFVMVVFDVDDEGNHPAKHAWAVKQALLTPNEPGFATWSDVRIMGELVIE